jgi:Methyl-accepting chemotaxis protein
MKFIHNIKLAQKISILSVSFFIFLSLIGFNSIRQLSVANSKLKEYNDSRVAPIVELENAKSKIEYIRSEGNALMDASDDDTKKTVQDEIASSITFVEKTLEKYKNDAQFKTLFTNYDSFISAKDTFVQSMSERQTQKQSSQPQQGSDNSTLNQGPPEDMQNFDNAKSALVSSFDEIINKHVAEAKQTYADSETAYNRTIIEIVVLVAVCAVIILILSIIIIRSITLPVKKVTSKLKEISLSNGDLTQRIGYEGKDEIGQLGSSFDLFMDKLQSIISEVAVSAETISSSSQKLNESAEDTVQSLEGISGTIAEIASGTCDGAAVVEETTASLTEAAKFSEDTSNASRSTAQNSKKAREAAEDGAAKIDEIVSSITDIANSSKEVSDIINELDKSSNRIGDIIKIITSISEQTNLLALNAAIEAARAGEAGRGFNVVADEIRKLADESNNAAKEISELVKENQVKSACAVNSVSQVDQKVSTGVSRASEVGESIQNIIKNIKDIVSEIEHVENANEQQAQSTREIEKAISNIAVTSNEIAGKTENISTNIEDQLKAMTEIEKTTEMLSEMAKKLNQITSGFII